MARYTRSRAAARTADHSSMTGTGAMTHAEIERRLLNGFAGGAAEQPTADQWTLEIAEYGHDDATGANIARLEAVVTTGPQEVVYFSAFQYADTVAPSDPALYESVVNQPRAASGPTILTWWVTRPPADQTYQVVITASSAEFQAFPNNVTTSAPKSVVVEAVQPPDQCTDFVVTAIVGFPGGVPSGRLSYAFTPPADLEYFTTNIYAIETDSAYVPLVGATWNLVASTVDAFTQDEFSWWPIGADGWHQFKAQSVSRAGLENTTSPPTSNLFVEHVDPTGGTDPTQPTGAEWSASVAEYGHDDQTGANVARLEAIVVVRPAGTKYFSVWSYEGSAPPTDLSQWTNVCNTAMTASGNTPLTWWVDRQLTATTYQLAVTASSGATVWPVSATPVHAVVVNPISDPAQVTGFSVVAHLSPPDVGPGTVSGLPSGQFEYIFTLPVDPEYWTTRIYRIWTNSSYVPLSGAVWELVSSPDKSFRQSDWWPQHEENWSTYKIQSYSRAYRENTTAPPTFNLHIPAGAGFDMSKAAPVSLDSTDFQIVSGKLAIKNVDLGKALGSSYNGVDFHIVGGKLTVKGVDLSKTISTTIGAALALTSGVLGVTPGGITETLISNFAISQNKLVDGAVVNSKIANFAVDAAKIANAAIQNAHIDRLSANKLVVVNADILNLAANKVLAGTLISGVVYTGSLTANQIVSGTIASNIVYAGNILAGQITSGTFTSGVVYAGVINVNQLQAGTATFTGSVTFQYNFGAAVTINSGSVVLRASASFPSLTLDSSGITVATGTGFNTVIGQNVTTFQITAVTHLASGSGSVFNAQFGAVYRMNGVTIIDTSGNYVGGVASTSYGIGGTGHNTYAGGWYYGVSSASFATGDGRTVHVRGGIIWFVG